MLFLKYLEDFKRNKQTAAELSGQAYQPIIEEQYKWNVWVTPKKPDNQGMRELMNNCNIKGYLWGDGKNALLL